MKDSGTFKILYYNVLKYELWNTIMLLMHLLYYVTLVLSSPLKRWLVTGRDYHCITIFSHCNLTGICHFWISLPIISEPWWVLLLSCLCYVNEQYYFWIWFTSYASQYLNVWALCMSLRLILEVKVEWNPDMAPPFVYWSLWWYI